MKVYASNWTAALAAGGVRTAGAVKIEATTDFLVWGGAGNLVLNGETYIGIGDAGLVSVSGSQIGGTEDAISLVLSGVDPEAAALMDTSGSRNARVTTWRLGFDVSGTSLLDASIFDRGRLDKLSRDDQPGAGGKATVTATVETAIRGLGKMTGRRTADADQRAILATDPTCSKVTQAGQLTLAWGGKPPARVVDSLPTGSRPVDIHIGGPFPDITVHV